VANGIRVGSQWRILGSDLLNTPQMYQGSDEILTKSLLRLSEPAFVRAWDNDEDSEYDGL
jgi:hypothetical protein